MSKNLLEQLKETDSKQVAKQAAVKNPPSKEDLDKLKLVDSYNITKHIACIKIGFIYLLALASGIFLFLMGGICIWMIFLYFNDISSDPIKIKDFLGTCLNIILTILSTLFLNYVLSKNNK